MAASTKTRAVVLKAVKNITIRFCPFESNVRSTRQFLVRVNSERARSTNLNCQVIPVVRHDASEPEVDVTYVDGERLVMKGAKLTVDEMMEAFQSRCINKDPQAKAAAKK